MSSKSNQKALVTYASRSGSTIGVAEAIAVELQQSGVDVDVLAMSDVTDVSQYAAVVAGSAIRQESWLPEALQFIQTHSEALDSKPVATFLTCMALATDNTSRYERALVSAAKWMDPVRAMLNPVSEGLFAGALDVSKVEERPFRLLFRILTLLRVFAEGDYRNWNVIRQWAHVLPTSLRLSSN